jgi:RNA polymerase sigma factor (sigma-70 family)
MQVMPLLNDQELIARYMDGDEHAFEVLLRRYKSKIYTSIYLFVKDQALAEDIFQEVFIKIIDTLRRGKYNHEGKFVQWAMRIAYNMCVDYHRRHKRRAHINPSDEFDIFEVLRHGDEGADSIIMRSETHNRIRKLVDSLPPEQREVVVLRHYADMSFKEIASLTRVSINTALGRMRYALINIRKMMHEREVVLQEKICLLYVRLRKDRM